MASLSLSNEEYRVLLEMVNLATYVAQYHARGGREDWLEAFGDISDKILGMAEDHDCAELVELEPDSGRLAPVEDYENESFFRECIDEMIEQCFWEDLVARLSDRDLARTMSAKQWENLSDKERSRRREERDKFYWSIFESQGIDSLECIHRQQHG